VADFIFRHGGNILHADEHADSESGLFVLRVEFDLLGFDVDVNEFSNYFEPLASKFKMEWRMEFASHRPRIVVLVSKQDHCLADLLYRQKIGELDCDIPLIISNHPDNAALAQFYGIPYEVIENGTDKANCEARILERLRTIKPDLLVLARYMQILSGDFVSKYPHKIINIHHSFLPAFIGAKPYHRAFERGVKLIGATSHYVTQILDDGPIIEQDVVRISHRDTVDDLIRKGRDLERMVLARAVRWHLEHRILLYGHKTVVFV